MAQNDYQDYEYLDEDMELDTENTDPDNGSLKLNSQVFEEILILEVQERPCLWDQRLNIKLRGMNITRKAWEEVGQALNVDAKICQKKWKNLRDTFLRKCKDEKSYIASGSAATNKVMNWKYYKQMQFLKPTAEHRRTFSNIQMVEDVNERLPGFCPRNNTEKEYIEQTWIEDRTSPSLLTTMRDGNKSISTLLSPPSICKTAQRDISFLPSTSPSSRSSICKTAQHDICFLPSTSPSSQNSICKTAQHDISFLPSTSPSSRSSTPLSSISCSSQKRKKFEETVNITSKSKKSCTEYPDRFEEFITEQVTQPLSEAATFCNFVKTRLEKLDRRYYLEATHNIMNELIRLETKSEEETSGK